jgi:hypothetical protein
MDSSSCLPTHAQSLGHLRDAHPPPRIPFVHWHGTLALRDKLRTQADAAETTVLKRA